MTDTEKETKKEKEIFLEKETEKDTAKGRETARETARATGKAAPGPKTGGGSAFAEFAAGKYFSIIFAAACTWRKYHDSAALGGVHQ